jgi:hypothetical protein
MDGGIRIGPPLVHSGVSQFDRPELRKRLTAATSTGSVMLTRSLVAIPTAGNAIYTCVHWLGFKLIQHHSYYLCFD